MILLIDCVENAMKEMSITSVIEDRYKIKSDNKKIDVVTICFDDLFE